jgi:hypothetical protein
MRSFATCSWNKNDIAPTATGFLARRSRLRSRAAGGGAEIRGRPARCLGEGAGEIGRRGKAQMLGDLAGGHVGIQKQPARLVHDAFGQERMGRAPRGLPADAAEMGGRDLKLLGIVARSRARCGTAPPSVRRTARPAGGSVRAGSPLPAAPVRASSRPRPAANRPPARVPSPGPARQARARSFPGGWSARPAPRGWRRAGETAPPAGPACRRAAGTAPAPGSATAAPAPWARAPARRRPCSARSRA